MIYVGYPDGKRNAEKISPLCAELRILKNLLRL
jgi:hypothetical protein